MARASLCPTECKQKGDNMKKVKMKTLKKYSWINFGLGISGVVSLCASGFAEDLKAYLKENEKKKTFFEDQRISVAEFSKLEEKFDK